MCVCVLFCNLNIWYFENLKCWKYENMNIWKVESSSCRLPSVGMAAFDRLAHSACSSPSTSMTSGCRCRFEPRLEPATSVDGDVWSQQDVFVQQHVHSVVFVQSCSYNACSYSRVRTVVFVQHMFIQSCSYSPLVAKCCFPAVEWKRLYEHALYQHDCTNIPVRTFFVRTRLDEHVAVRTRPAPPSHEISRGRTPS